MVYFGLTGGAATGKSTVARMFERLGARVIDADQIGHEVIRAGQRAYQEIVEQFGPGILDTSADIDRRRLGPIVFADPTKLAALNAIVHPRIIARIEELVQQYSAENPRTVILVDAALIYEAGIGRNFAKIVVTWCRPEQQVERLMAKTGVSRAEAERRIVAQMTAQEKRRRADYVIDCSGSIDESRAQAKQIYAELKSHVEFHSAR